MKNFAGKTAVVETIEKWEQGFLDQGSIRERVNVEKGKFKNGNRTVQRIGQSNRGNPVRNQVKEAGRKTSGEGYETVVRGKNQNKKRLNCNQTKRRGVYVSLF